MYYFLFIFRSFLEILKKQNYIRTALKDIVAAFNIADVSIYSQT